MTVIYPTISSPKIGKITSVTGPNILNFSDKTELD